jgi:hypothetical protein
VNNSFTAFRNVIAAVRRGELGRCAEEPTYFNVYWKYDDDEPDLDDEIFVGEPTEVDDDVPDEEYDAALLPPEVKERDWWLCYSGELIEDVVSNALMQKSTLNDQELLDAIRYYSKRDAFLEF